MKKIMKNAKKFSKILLVLLFSFSQLSFPIGVLADELQEVADNSSTTKVEDNVVEDIINETNKEDETLKENTYTTDSQIDKADETNTLEDESEKEVTDDTNTYKVTINGESVTEYTIDSSSVSKVITIVSGTADNSKEEVIDFSNKLYGDYTYTYNIPDSEEVITITIHNNGDNSEILSNYVDDKITVSTDTVSINGTKEGISKEEFLSYFNEIELYNDYNASISIDNEFINNINNNVNIILTNGEVTSKYSIVVNGDYNNDGLVDEEDAKYIVDLILDSNEEVDFSIVDATNPVFKTGSWDNLVTANDTLKNTLDNVEETYKGTELVVKYYINGFDKDVLTGIEGTINYDNSLLELTNVEVSNLYGNTNYDDGHFAYLLDNYASEDVFMTLTFNTLSAGNATISIDDILASNGTKLNLDSTVSTSVTILEGGKGGDVLDNETTTTETTSTTPTEDTTIIPILVTNSVVAKTISLSSDNLIKSLTIKGHDIDFDSNTLEYSIKVKNSVNSLNLDIVLSDEAASYEISGNKNFKVGENVVTIKVTAEDGSERTYTIKVTREKAKEKEDEEEKDSSKTIIIILIILVIIGLIYVIFKDDEEENEESKK